MGSVLSTEHGVFQLIHGHAVVGPGVHHFAFKQEAAVNIHHGLSGFHKAALQQGKTLLILSLRQHQVAKKRLVEN